MASLLKTIIHGLATSMGIRIFAMGLRFLTIFLLPFWLSPHEVGLMALILACVNLPVAFADFGFGTAIIKEIDTSQRMFQSVFTFVLISTTIIATAIILGAPIIESTFALPAGLTIIAAFALPFNAFAILPNAILQRNLRFTNLAIRDLVGEIVFSGTAIVLAILGFGALSIAIAAVAMRFVRWAIASLSVDWHPAIRIHRDDLKKLTKFSLYQFGSLSVTQVFNQIDKLLLAAYLTPATLGLYSQAQQFTVAPVNSLSGAANNVFFASFSKVQDDDDTLRSLFTKILKGFILVSGLAVGAISPALHIVPLVYNDAWVEVVPIALTMCLFLPATCAFIFEGTMIAIGGEKRRLQSCIIKLLILTIGIVSAFACFPDLNGPIAIAVIFGLAITTSACINLHFILKRLRLQSFWPFVKSLAIAVTFALTGLTLGFFWL